MHAIKSVFYKHHFKFQVFPFPEEVLYGKFEKWQQKVDSMIKTLQRYCGYKTKHNSENMACWMACSSSKFFISKKSKLIVLFERLLWISHRINFNFYFNVCYFQKTTYGNGNAKKGETIMKNDFAQRSPRSTIIMFPHSKSYWLKCERTNNERANQELR